MHLDTQKFDEDDALLVSQWINRMVSDEVLTRIDRHGSGDPNENVKIARLMVFGESLCRNVAGRAAYEGLTREDIDQGKLLDRVTDTIHDQIDFLRSDRGQDIHSDALVNELSDLVSGLKYDPEYRQEAQDRTEQEITREMSERAGIPVEPTACRYECLATQIRRSSERFMIDGLNQTLFSENRKIFASDVRKAIEPVATINHQLTNLIESARRLEEKTLHAYDAGRLGKRQLLDKLQSIDTDLRGKMVGVIADAEDGGNPAAERYRSMYKSMDETLSVGFHAKEREINHGGEFDAMIQSDGVMKMRHELPDIEDPMNPDPDAPGTKNKSSGPGI